MKINALVNEERAGRTVLTSGTTLKWFQKFQQGSPRGGEGVKKDSGIKGGKGIKRREKEKNAHVKGRTLISLEGQSQNQPGGDLKTGGEGGVFAGERQRKKPTSIRKT